jgi:hypothetical protein
MLPLRPKVLVVLSLAFVACNRTHPAVSAKDEASAPSRESGGSGASRESSESRESRIEAVVCAGRTDCHLENVVDGGKSRQGASLFAAMVRVPKSFVVVAGSCPSSDLWLVSVLGEDVSVVRRLAQPCVGEGLKASIRVLAPGELRLEIPEAPGEHWEAHDQSEAWDFTLDPPDLIREFFGDRFWDYREFKGGKCPKNAVDACENPSLTLPSLDTGDAFAAGEWRTTSLGECSMHFGPVRALVSRGVLYVEVEDSGASPLPLLVNVVLPDGLPQDMQTWTLRMDGTLAWQVNGKNRSPTSAHVETAAAAGSSVRRFMLTGVWPKALAETHMSYGAQQSGTYGVVHNIDPARTTCEPHEGVLKVVNRPPDADPSTAIGRLTFLQ